MRYLYLAATVLLLSAVSITGQSTGETAAAKEGKLLVVGTAHLDTQWRWTVKKSIEEYIPATFRDNYKLMDLYPDYVFSFEGAFRYMLMHEYYPDDFERVRPYIASGQWRVTGSWVDAVDVNLPSPESLIRHTLYGNGYFKQEFGKTSRDIFLPDCFGFGYALPSIAAHCGLECFSTQKLTWGSWVGRPFDIGIWKGVDGSSIAAAVNPGAYVSEIKGDLSRDTAWLNTARRQGEKSGLYAAYSYFGTGDTGGSPDSASVDWLSKSIHSDGPLQVMSAGADDIVDLVKSSDRSKLPLYDGELIMTRHGTGCYTSQAAMKRWNRKNELLADAAERISVIAHLLGGQQYPREMLRDTWIRFLWHQFHDDLTGTSIPEAYEYSWNDEILCQNRFAAVLTKAVRTASAVFDTRVEGVPVIVYNPNSVACPDNVEIVLHVPGFDSKYIRAYDGQGENPCDIIEKYADSVRIRFNARVPQVGLALYDMRSSNEPPDVKPVLSVSGNHLENEHYKVSINEAGEVSSIYDKMEEKELLSAPLRYEILEDTPNRWPAWEVDFDDIMAAPLDLFVGKPEIKVIENGFSSVAVKITQKTENSVFNTIVRLTADGRLVEFETDIDWYERAKLLKLALATTVPNDIVTYDIGLGVIERGLNSDKRYEVPGQQWADVTAKDGRYGVALFNDCKYGWDHPAPEKLRLTLIHTPGIADGWDWVGDERSQDNGHHTMKFAVYGHRGDWRDGEVAWQAARFNQPLLAFQTTKHEGFLENRSDFCVLHLGKVRGAETGTYSSADYEPAVLVTSMKLAENSDEIIIRLRDLTGQSNDNNSLTFGNSFPILAAREVNGQEETIAPVDVEDGRLRYSLTPFQIKAFAVTLKNDSRIELKRPTSLAVDLPYNIDGISSDDDRCDGDFDGRGYTLSGDLISDTLDYLDIPFVFGPKENGKMNVVRCEGQEVKLPNGMFNHLYLLAASVDGPTQGAFIVDTTPTTVNLQDYADPVGQWNNRMLDGAMVESPELISPTYINRMPVAWYGSHRHTPECENDIYRFTYLYLIDLNLSGKAEKLVLPVNDRIRIMAATLVYTPYEETSPAQPLYDEARYSLVRIATDSSSFGGRAAVALSSPVPAASIYYTLDGSRPTTSSARYTEPIIVDATTTINARAFNEGYNDNYVASKTVNKLTLREAVTVTGFAAGLTGKYYEGEWERLPDFDSVTSVAEFIADAVAIPDIARDENYALTFEGFVMVPQDGVYAFSIHSDDGSRLYISDTLLVDNDGAHGDYDMAGLIGLKAGYHRFTAQMFQGVGDEALGVSLAGPSLARRALPASMLFYRK
ncbi:MAG: glycoside hydrolase family 38 C-terminal domain-containing protein [Candidatus Zixiibacteriota bacterium]